MRLMIGPAASRSRPRRHPRLHRPRGRLKPAAPLAPALLLVLLGACSAPERAGAGQPDAPVARPADVARAEPARPDVSAESPRRAQASPRADCLGAARAAERRHGLPHGLLVAMALSESGLHANALNIGGRAHFPDQPEVARRMLAAAPARHAVMAGCLQVNARVHARGSAWPLDPDAAANWSAAQLARTHAATGDWTAALRRWHGGHAAGSQRVVCRVAAKLQAVNPGSRVLDDAGCAAPATLRARRNGAALLEVAEASER